MSYQIKNPILSGFYPDPSICRVGDDFYLACSSFSFFPGVPLFHSRDLAHWEPIGYALDRVEQLRTTPDRLSGGTYAPTLRYHDGTFYLIVGNTTTGENILVTATDPAGDWSNIHDIKGVGGDPSLFWDDDGTCWCSYNTAGIYHQQLDLETYALVGEPIHLWDGASAGAWSPEASHMYKKDGWYYLMIAEGGTEHYHAVSVARSRNIHGPYSNYRGNPILTHRHLTMHHPICNIGHGDIVDTPNGEWYMVVLGSRIYGGYHKNMGRETFICPVIWENEWPIAAPDTGKVEFAYPASSLPEFPMTGFPDYDDFDDTTLGGQWNYIGTPTNSPARIADSKLYIRTVEAPIWKAEKHSGSMEMPDLSDPEVMARIMEEMQRMRENVDPVALGFVGRRQTAICYTAETRLSFDIANDSETAGIVLLQNNFNQIRLEVALENGRKVIRAIRFKDIIPSPMMGDVMPKLPVVAEQGTELLGVIPCPEGDVVLQLRAKSQSHDLYAGPSQDNLLPVAVNIDGGFLGSETSGGFVGAYVGMFASGNGLDTRNEAGFDYFHYTVH